jgi:hypothetical protein
MRKREPSRVWTLDDYMRGEADIWPGDTYIAADGKAYRFVSSGTSPEYLIPVSLESGKA